MGASKGFRKASREPGYQQYAIRKVVDHPNYNKDVVYGDISLLLIHDKFSYSEFVRPACLPQSSRYSPSEGAFRVITGFGKSDGSKNLLNKATLPLVDYRKCRELLTEVANSDGGHVETPIKVKFLMIFLKKSDL